MQDQLFVANRNAATGHDTGAPEAGKLQPVLSNEGVQWNGKPADCGLWTSTRLSRGYSDWVRWCASEMPHWLAGNRYRLTVRPDARVFTLTAETVDSLPYFTARDHWGNERAYIDYVSLFTEYDGFHYARRGADYGRFGWRHFEYFDVESTVWARWCFDVVTLDNPRTKADACPTELALALV